MVTQSNSFTLKPYLELGRISNLPTVISNVLLGFALINQDIDPMIKVIMIFSGFCFYIAGMYMNDICDYEWDKENKNSRPLVTGEVNLEQVKLIKNVFFLSAFILYGIANILTNFNLISLLYPLALTAFISWYNYDHKDNSLSPVLMGLCRVFLILSASALITPQFNIIMLGVLLTYVSYTGALTFAAKFEHKNSFNMKLIPKLIYLSAPFFLFYFSQKNTISIINLFLLISWSLYNLWLLNKKRIGLFVTNSIAAMVLIDSMIIVGDNLYAFIALCLLFIGTLLFQKKIAGT